MIFTLSRLCCDADINFMGRSPSALFLDDGVRQAWCEEGALGASLQRGQLESSFLIWQVWVTRHSAVHCFSSFLVSYTIMT